MLIWLILGIVIGLLIPPAIWLIVYGVKRVHARVKVVKAIKALGLDLHYTKRGLTIYIDYDDCLEFAAMTKALSEAVGERVWHMDIDAISRLKVCDVNVYVIGPPSEEWKRYSEGR